MSIPLRKMGRALSRFGPLTDVWVVASVVSTTEITVALWQRPGADGAPGAAPNLGASVLADYQGALVRFDTGDLSGITQGVGVNATGAFITTIDTVTTTTSPAVCTVTFKDAMPVTPAAGDLLTVIRNLRNGSTVDINGNVQATIDTSGGPVDISGPVTFPSAQDVNLAANNAGTLDVQGTVDISGTTDVNIQNATVTTDSTIQNEQVATSLALPLDTSFAMPANSTAAVTQDVYIVTPPKAVVAGNIQIAIQSSEGYTYDLAISAFYRPTTGGALYPVNTTQTPAGGWGWTDLSNAAAGQGSAYQRGDLAFPQPINYLSIRLTPTTSHTNADTVTVSTQAIGYTANEVTSALGAAGQLHPVGFPPSTGAWTPMPVVKPSLWGYGYRLGYLQAIGAPSGGSTTLSLGTVHHIYRLTLSAYAGSNFSLVGVTTGYTYAKVSNNINPTLTANLADSGASINGGTGEELKIANTGSNSGDCVISIEYD